MASGSVDGHAWSVWSKHGQSGANGLETGGVVVDGVAHGLCPGFPNPGEMELLEPSGGGDGIAYGVVGYPGTAKVAIYRDTFGNFATTKLMGSTTAQKVNGVGFFITSLSESACDVPGVEMNTASSKLRHRAQPRVRHQRLQGRATGPDQRQPGDLGTAARAVPEQVPDSQRRRRRGGGPL